MIHHCAYCNTPFTALRKDKQYCSHSCKQLAFLKRQNGSVGFAFPKYQNVNDTKRQINGTSNGQNLKPSNTNTDGLDIETSKAETVNQTILVEEVIYTPIKCKWINKLYERFDERGNDGKFISPTTVFKDEVHQVQWVSLYYRCLLECVIIISEMKIVEWADLAELTNAFTFLIGTTYFKELPENYPYTKEIISLRDKLKHFCLETQVEELVQFCLKFETKKELLLQRFELSSAFPTISFNQLQADFRAENAIHLVKTGVK